MPEVVHIDLDAEPPVSELMRQMGYRDGQKGLNPSSTSKDYWAGYGEGRRKRMEDKLRYGEIFDLMYGEREE